MPVPQEYQRAGELFYDFLTDTRDMADLGSTHQAYTMVQGVLQTFRQRLSVKEAIRFAGVLPPVLRAIFVADWDIDEPRRPFEDRKNLAVEVRSLRPLHNFSPDTAIENVAAALRKYVDKDAFDKVLAGLPEGAKEFWKV